LLTSDESEGRKKIIIESVVHDCDVQYRWSIISADISDDYISIELLTHIVSIWLNTRGFAVSRRSIK